VSSFHTAAILHVARHAASSKKENLARTRERRKREYQDKPSFVLGTRTSVEDDVWKKCDLAQCLVNPHNLNGPPALPSPPDTNPYSLSTLPSVLTETMTTSEGELSVTIPKNTNYGIDTPEKQMLFQELPSLTAVSSFTVSESHFRAAFDAVSDETSHKSSGLGSGSGSSSASATGQGEQMQKLAEESWKKEKMKADAFAKMVDLHNANARGITYENRRRIVLQFSGPENSFDPGRAEVQGEKSFFLISRITFLTDMSSCLAALLTYQIRNLWNHLTTFKRDVSNRRPLLKLIHQRAKILRYLKRLDRNRYEVVLPRLALDPRSIEGELTL